MNVSVIQNPTKNSVYLNPRRPLIKEKLMNVSTLTRYRLDPILGIVQKINGHALHHLVAEEVTA